MTAELFIGVRSTWQHIAAQRCYKHHSRMHRHMTAELFRGVHSTWQHLAAQKCYKHHSRMHLTHDSRAVRVSFGRLRVLPWSKAFPLACEQTSVTWTPRCTANGTRLPESSITISTFRVKAAYAIVRDKKRHVSNKTGITWTPSNRRLSGSGPARDANQNRCHMDAWGCHLNGGCPVAACP